jgi:multidrug resistance efflux pump
MRPNHGIEAPTFLGSHQLPLPPEWSPPGDDSDEADALTRASHRSRSRSEPGSRREAIGRSAPAGDRRASASSRPHASDHGAAERASAPRRGATERAERGERAERVPIGAYLAPTGAELAGADLTPRGHRNARLHPPLIRAAPYESAGARAVAYTPPEPSSIAARASLGGGASSAVAGVGSRSVSGSIDPARATTAPNTASPPTAAGPGRRGPGKRAAARPSDPPAAAAPAAPGPAAAPREEGRSSSRPRPTPAPEPAAAAQAPAQPLPNGMTSIDPLQVPVPAELSGPLYGWIRRLALQADLAGADRVLRDALADMTSSLAVAIVYPGESGLWTLGEDEEIPRDPQPIIAVGQARRAVVGTHSALIPILTSTEAVAVVVLTRNPRNPPYHPFEQIAAVALAREAAAILHHLAVQHLQRAAEVKADQGSLYRGEALEAHRTRGQEGHVVHLSPSWVRRAYPILVAAMVIGVVAAVVVTVPTYSTGTAVVIFDGTPITAPIGGTVDQLAVSARQAVKQGQVLLRLNNAAEAAELAAATSDYENATIQYLFDPQDEQTKKTLASALTRVDRARAQAETRVVRARTAGVVGDLRIRVGSTLNAGDVALTIVQPTVEPEITAFLPGKDRPRLRLGMPLQVDLIGFTKARELATISSIATEVVAGEEIAARILGPGLAGSFRQLTGSNWVIVRAKLPKRTFESEKRTHYYHHGMQAKTEVKIQSKPFLVTLLPALDKYLQ